MKILFPPSGNGDCIFCVADKGNGSHLSMMIDCHVFTPEIKAIVTEILNCHINFLVVTHIDIDHIDGICNMLYQMPKLKIDHIIYNNLFVEQADRAQIEPLTDFEKEQIKKIKSSYSHMEAKYRTYSCCKRVFGTIYIDSKRLGRGMG